MSALMGSGTLLGGNAGQAFWYGHNEQGYGFIDLADTPLFGLDEVALQRKGWELGVAHVRQNPASIVSSAFAGTNELFSPGKQDYGVFWATRTGAGDRSTVPNLRWELETFAGISRAGAWILTIVSALVLLNWRAVAPKVLVLVALVVAANWFFYAVVFLGNPRYRYMTDVVLSIVAASVVVLIRGQTSPTAAETKATNGLNPKPVQHHSRLCWLLRSGGSPSRPSPRI